MSETIRRGEASTVRKRGMVSLYLRSHSSSDDHEHQSPNPEAVHDDDDDDQRAVEALADDAGGAWTRRAGSCGGGRIRKPGRRKRSTVEVDVVKAVRWIWGGQGERVAINSTITHHHNLSYHLNPSHFHRFPPLFPC